MLGGKVINVNGTKLDENVTGYFVEEIRGERGRHGTVARMTCNITGGFAPAWGDALVTCASHRIAAPFIRCQCWKKCEK